MSESIRSPCVLNESAVAVKPEKRLMETVSLTFERLEEAGKATLLKIKGTAGMANIVNANGRYYPADVVMAAVEESQSLIQDGRFLSLSEHPDYDEPDTGELDDVAARVTAFSFNEADNTLSYEAVLLETDAGKNTRALLEGGVKVQASTRALGVGEVVTAGELGLPDVDAAMPIYKVTSLKYLGIDLTLNPSVASTDAALTESQVNPPPIPEPEEKIMDVETLKKDHPALYEAIIKQGKTLAESQQQSASVEAELARLKAENDKLKQDSLNSVRKNIVSKSLTEAALPKLGNAGEIDLDARFAAQVEQAAMNAESDVAAQNAVDILITERRALLGQNPTHKAAQTHNRAGLPAGNTEKHLNEAQDDVKKQGMNEILSARAVLGL